MEQEVASTTTMVNMPKPGSSGSSKVSPLPSSRFRRVCVFCGSSTGRKSSYQHAAVQLGQQLVERGIDLVYGGGSVGLMGLVSRAVHNGGGHVIGYVRHRLPSARPHLLLHILNSSCFLSKQRQSNKDTEQPREQQPSSPPFFSGTGALVRAFVRDHHLDRPRGMEMKKIACAVLVAASATVALAAEAPAPAPGATSGSAAAVPAVGAMLGATVLSFFAYYLQ